MSCPPPSLCPDSAHSAPVNDCRGAGSFYAAQLKAKGAELALLRKEHASVLRKYAKAYDAGDRWRKRAWKSEQNYEDLLKRCK